MDSVDVVVIGAGVVGLACAKQLAEAGREVIVLERETAFGTGISARNSEVIHAGLYYPPGSLKATLCVQGRQALYAYCAERGVAHRRIGKLVVASRAPQLPALAAIAARARANGVNDLRLLDGAGVRALEPELDAAGGLFSPSTGIVDSHGLMQALLADADLVLVMEKGHLQEIGRRAPQARGKTFLLGKWRGDAEIPDPYRKDEAAFERAYQLIDDCVAPWAARIAPRQPA